MTMIKLVVVTLLLVLFFLMKAQSKKPPMRLGTYRIEKKWITISGHSSGASFSHNFHLAYSKLFYGVGIFSGLYYQYNGVMDKPFKVNPDDKDPPGVGVDNSIDYLNQYNEVRLVDQLTCLRCARIFVYGGTADEYHGVEQRVFAIKKIYKPHVKDPANQIKIVTKYAPHKPPTGECTANDVANGFQCSYNGISDMFDFLYKSRLKVPSGKVKLQKVRKFDQTEFFHNIGDGDEIAMNDFGLIYIPSGCSHPKDKCLLHLYFCGCSQRSTCSHAPELYYKIAEVNSIILVTPIQKFTKANPGGCWDFVGFSGSRYATHEGLQIQVVRKIIGRILGKQRKKNKKRSRKI